MIVRDDEPEELRLLQANRHRHGASVRRRRLRRRAPQPFFSGAIQHAEHDRASIELVREVEAVRAALCRSQRTVCEAVRPLPRAGCRRNAGLRSLDCRFRIGRLPVLERVAHPVLRVDDAFAADSSRDGVAHDRHRVSEIDNPRQLTHHEPGDPLAIRVIVREHEPVDLPCPKFH